MPMPFCEAVQYNDPITRQTFDYETPFACSKNLQKVFAHDLSADDFSVSTLNHLKEMFFSFL